MSFKEKIIHKCIVVLLWVGIMYCYVYDIADLFKSFSTPSSLNLVCFRLLLPLRGFVHTLFFHLFRLVLSSASCHSGQFSHPFLFEVVFIAVVSTRLRLLWYHVLSLFIVFMFIQYCIIILMLWHSCWVGGHISLMMMIYFQCFDD